MNNNVQCSMFLPKTDPPQADNFQLRKGLIKKILLFVACFLLFALYSFLPLSQLFDSSTRGAQYKFDTPDETINYAFAYNFTKTSRLYYVEYLNEYLPHPIVFPRWARPDGAYMYPGSFLGLILISGMAGKMFGAFAIPFVTPLAAVLCVVLVYALTKRMFTPLTAFVSALFCAFFPVFAYYASRTMFHSIVFLFFVLLGLWSYLTSFDNEKYDVLYYIAGLSFGVALFVRFADAWWVGLLILMLVIFQRKDPKRLMVFVGILALLTFSMLYLNHSLYGHWLDFGYPIGGKSMVADSGGILGYVFPFGFHPHVIWKVVVDVLVRPYWWFVLISFVGYGLVVKDYWNAHKREVIISSISLLLIIGYIIALYGSWGFSDSIDPNVIAISSSYYRYMLPVLILSIPFAAYLVTRAVGLIKSQSLRIPVLSVTLATFCVVSYSIMFLGEEGLAHTRRQVLEYRREVLSLLGRGANYNDLFLAHRGEDKMLFPELPKVVNVDYLKPEYISESLSKYGGVVWASEGGIFRKVKTGN